MASAPRSAQGETIGTIAKKKYGAQPQAVALLRRVARMYEGRNVLQGNKAPSLRSACVCGTDCWKGVPSAERAKPAKAGISLPWIGPDYFDHRIVVVGMNLVAYGGLWANWESKRWQLEALDEGSKRIDGSPFAYAIASYAYAVSSASAGEHPEQTPDPVEAAQALRRCAFLQEVKCSPSRTRSRPEEAMNVNCQREYLLDELDVLEPRTLIVLAPSRSSDYGYSDSVRTGITRAR